jgi:hypothetical protein
MVRLLDENTIRLEWDGTLAAGETIDAAYEVYDLENLGDDLKELLFREQRVLAYLGENVIQDKILYNNAGVMTQYRLRVFDSKANANGATVDTENPSLETGELARSTVTQEIVAGKNDRSSLAKVLDLLLTTPGVD